MSECIIIASWMLAIIGFVLMLVAGYWISKEDVRDGNIGLFVSIFIIGLVMFLVCGEPYVPDLSHIVPDLSYILPCIKVIP